MTISKSRYNDATVPDEKTCNFNKYSWMKCSSSVSKSVYSLNQEHAGQSPDPCIKAKHHTNFLKESIETEQKPTKPEKGKPFTGKIVDKGQMLKILQKGPVRLYKLREG